MKETRDTRRDGPVTHSVSEVKFSSVQCFQCFRSNLGLIKRSLREGKLRLRGERERKREKERERERLVCELELRTSVSLGRAKRRKRVRE